MLLLWISTGYYRWNGKSSAHQSWFCSWNHPRKTLNRYRNDFLRCIATGDETWIHYTPESKHQSKEWKHLTSQVINKLTTQPSAGKSDVDTWGGGGVCTGANYGTLPKEGHNNKRSVIVKCFGTSWNQPFEPNAKDYCLKMSQFCTIMSAHIVESLRHLNFELLKHPPYSPDLAPPITCLVYWQDALRGCHFVSYQELKEAVHAWLVKNVFYSGHTELVDHWTRCVKGWELYEKMVLLYILIFTVICNKKLRNWLTLACNQWYCNLSGQSASLPVSKKRFMLVYRRSKKNL